MKLALAALALVVAADGGPERAPAADAGADALDPQMAPSAGGSVTGPTLGIGSRARCPVRAGEVRVTLRPSDATLWIDGQRWSGLMRVRAGRHTLAATAPGHERAARKVELRAGASSKLSLLLTPERGAPTGSADDGAEIVIPLSPASGDGEGPCSLESWSSDFPSIDLDR